MSGEKDPPEDQPTKPAIEPDLGGHGIMVDGAAIINVLIIRKSTVQFGANTSKMQSFIQQIDTNDVFHHTNQSVKEIDTWVGSMSKNHFTWNQVTDAVP